MVGERNEAQLGAPFLDLDNGVAVVLAVEFHTGIAHLTDGLQGAVEVLFEIGTDAVQLHSHRKFPGEGRGGFTA